MSRYLALHDGLFLGSSAAVNLVAAVKLAKEWGEEGRGKRIVTILWSVVSLASPTQHSADTPGSVIPARGITVDSGESTSSSPRHTR